MGLHARLYDAICGWEEKRGLLEWRRQLVSDVEGEVLEIAAGTGLNLRHYSKRARVFASEFDPVMLARAVERARQSIARVCLLVADAMRLPVPDESVDVVVIGLALCSIPDPAAALTEARRVLRPHGKLRFIEHVRADEGTFEGRAQDAFNPVWRVISGGCNCNRRSEQTVRSTGFDIVEIHRFRMGLPLLAPHVMAEAVPA
ncbi:MAG: class I SAM-dependent methyltransferase [Actinomycetota bacterium]|nr:class I SAM-dependent methyltransferase [Actinomycetota bacterium]